MLGEPLRKRTVSTRVPGAGAHGGEVARRFVHGPRPRPPELEVGVGVGPHGHDHRSLRRYADAVDVVRVLAGGQARAERSEQRRHRLGEELVLLDRGGRLRSARADPARERGRPSADGTSSMPKPVSASKPAGPRSRPERRITSKTWLASSCGLRRPDPGRRAGHDRRREARPGADPVAGRVDRLRHRDRDALAGGGKVDRGGGVREERDRGGCVGRGDREHVRECRPGRARGCRPRGRSPPRPRRASRGGSPR